ncbi:MULTISPECIES: hypothetical protein [Streptomyces]|uniref:hypothetical protein n=1 Tax=Streptomyces TaxID=1883 RepID=UPI000AEECA29|nr:MULTISPECIES: hypothetical protein [Streptomyces]
MQSVLLGTDQVGTLADPALATYVYRDVRMCLDCPELSRYPETAEPPDGPSTR